MQSDGKAQAWRGWGALQGGGLLWQGLAVVGGMHSQYSVQNTWLICDMCTEEVVDEIMNLISMYFRKPVCLALSTTNTIFCTYKMMLHSMGDAPSLLRL